MWLVRATIDGCTGLQLPPIYATRDGRASLSNPSPKLEMQELASLPLHLHICINTNLLLSPSKPRTEERGERGGTSREPCRLRGRNLQGEQKIERAYMYMR